MSLTNQLLTSRNALIAGTAATCLALYLQVRPILGNAEPPPKQKVIVAHNQLELLQEDDHPYPSDAFPGGRLVRTEYGTIQIFEWGPEDGEKVLLMHGIGTPCIALGDMANEFVTQGYRVMLFGMSTCKIHVDIIANRADFFGRGYSDTPSDLPFDERLYTSQILLAIASSPISWTGPSSFHILGYSLGGAIAASFAAFHANLLRSVTLVCPGGLVRTSHVSRRSRFLYSSGILPEWLLQRLAWKRLQPKDGTPSADLPGVQKEDTEDDEDVDFDDVRVVTGARVGSVVKWQIRGNDGFVPAYMSTIRNAPIYGQHDKVWKVLGDELKKRRKGGPNAPKGLEKGKIGLVLAEKDPIVIVDEWLEDSKRVLGEDAVEAAIIKGGHEIAISKGKEVAQAAIKLWR